MHDTMMVNWILSIPVRCGASYEGKCYRIKYLQFMLISIIRTQCVSDTVFVLLLATLLDINKLLDWKMLKHEGIILTWVMLRKFNMKRLL